MIESQPPAFVYKQHPTKKGVMQRFVPSYTVDDLGVRKIELGKAIASFRVAVDDEKADTMIYDIEMSMLVAYVKC